MARYGMARTNGIVARTDSDSLIRRAEVTVEAPMISALS